MEPQKIWESITSTFQRNNPLTPKFIMWYLVVLIVTIIVIVSSQVLPMLQQTRQLNEAIQQGRVYLRSQTAPALTPDIKDFILKDKGSLNMEPLYPLRKVKERWSSAEIQEYWDDIGQKKLREIRQENQKILEEQLKDLP